MCIENTISNSSKTSRRESILSLSLQARTYWTNLNGAPEQKVPTKTESRLSESGKTLTAMI